MPLPIYYGIPAQLTSLSQRIGSFRLSPYGQPAHIALIPLCRKFYMTKAKHDQQQNKQPMR